MMFLALALCLPYGVDEPPPLADLDRFPPAIAVAEVLAFSSAYQDCLRLQQWLRPWDQTIAEALEETRDLRRIWDTLSRAQAGCEDGGETWIEYRRAELVELRRLLGPAAYHAGVLPPAVPTWRFRRLP